MLGIDVSENNGYIDWESVKNAGYEFAIIRVGWGHSHLDESFYDNINGAIDAGLKVGVYYYSYALSDDAAREEAEFCANLLEDCGLTNDMLEMGVWFDMEDADGYKDRNGFTDGQELTNCVNVFVNYMAEKGYRCIICHIGFDIYEQLGWKLLLSCLLLFSLYLRALLCIFRLPHA